MSAPFNCRFDGGIFRPLGRYAAECAARFKDGDIVRLEPILERSMKSHNHHFAWLQEAWRNLPESVSDDYPTWEHLRKRALIQAGFFDEEVIDCETQETALRLAPHIRKRDDFAMIFVRSQFIIIRTAKSQSIPAMGRKQFQESKDKVRAIVADLLGIAPEELDRNTDKAA